MSMQNVRRGFPELEFENRLQKMQSVMVSKKIDAVLLTTQANIYYFTGFLTQFWKSPTRPWFVILPVQGKPIAVIPSIGYSGMQNTWIDDIHTWDAPSPLDDGVSLLTSVLKDQCKRYNRIGVPMGQESWIQMPYENFNQVTQALSHVEFIDVALDLYKIRMVKSSLEIDKIERACAITSIGFDLLPSHAAISQTERQLSQQMTINLLNHGVDSVEYLICGSGPGGYDSIIMGPTDKPLVEGDIAIIDTGATFDGYYCDFCRNFAFGYITDQAKAANAVIHHSIDAAFERARPGNTTRDLFIAMWSVLEEGGALGNNVGRLGHGLGCELTEYPSNNAESSVELEPGMVITLEPGMYYAEGKSLVHEENIVITENGARWLSKRAEEEIPIIL